MFGTIVNTLAIIAGCLIGGFIKKGIPQKYEEAMLNACGLAACGIGFSSVISNMNKSEYPVLFIVSLVIGSVIGTKFDLDDKIQTLIKKYAKGNLGEGIVTAALLFCIGSLSIVGSVMAALKSDYTFLFTNASSSSGNMFFPFLRTITNFFLPVININPSLSILAKSPVCNHPSGSIVSFVASSLL